MVDFTDSLLPGPGSDGAEILKRERGQSTIRVKELSKHLFSHNGFLERQQRVLSIIEAEPLCSKTNQMNLSRPDRFHLGLARAKLTKRLSDKHGWDLEDNKMAEYLIDEMLPYHLHPNLFLTTMREQGSEEQKAYWLPRIEKYEIIGAYAQVHKTELGHGSNVRGLELEAKWDPRASEFVLHSPTLTASKWWNGALGRTANHAIVVAQLLLPQEGSTTTYSSYGPHPFVVQVRDMKTHLPLPGIVVGDIGAKFGYACMDNGYMLFDHFRIPHSAFLSRYSKVDPSTGAFSQPENSTVVYGTMTFVRSNIAMHARLILARAVTVAVRYTSIRRQFRDRDVDQNIGQEIPVLDYPTVQIRILPLLATTFALHYGAKAMGELYFRTREQVNVGDFAALADLHSTSSGLKSLCTGLAADGIETCRRALGGHGYGGGSGLVQLSHDYLAKPTVEGDNWMITQQVAAYLIKKMASAVKLPDSAASDDTDANLKAFIKARENPRTTVEYLDILNDDYAIVLAFRTRAASLVRTSWHHLVMN
ncbi:Peroxisomal acyl-coenzyme A oxidase 1 [Hyphodiscus hymeniophilus]|uniref:acyl-CoA oxidase n=1 Tax=Hyphodiscus hymeniophilus TaxID=353542 RepID=A0A9P7AYV8_9HELO|nr:Peroxisomal acyl-coenzyme A oxidase 1 [Hyphodiscus hymeniophilus]